MKAWNLTILTLVLLLFSCHNEQKEKENKIAHLVSEWQGKQIQFPEVHNTAVKELYLKQITGKDSPNNRQNRMIQVSFDYLIRITVGKDRK